MPGVRDFDRPLDETGHQDSEDIGEIMAANGYVPDLTLCSGAVRARQTLAGIAAKTDTGKVVFSDTLYMTDAAGYLDIIKENNGVDSLLVIGHNPMMEDLALAISGDGDDMARASLNAGFTTAGLAVVSFEGNLANAAPGKGHLDAFIAPGD